MSQAPHNQTGLNEEDPAEAVVKYIPWVLPVAGGVLMFLLAFIAVVIA